jgi:hypothetical protein
MSDSEDHAGDEWRYACMSRPWVPMKEAPKPENIPRRGGAVEKLDVADRGFSHGNDPPLRPCGPDGGTSGPDSEDCSWRK